MTHSFPTRRSSDLRPDYRGILEGCHHRDVAVLEGGGHEDLPDAAEQADGDEAREVEDVGRDPYEGEREARDQRAGEGEGEGHRGAGIETGRASCREVGCQYV